MIRSVTQEQRQLVDSQVKKLQLPVGKTALYFHRDFSALFVVIDSLHASFPYLFTARLPAKTLGK